MTYLGMTIYFELCIWFIRAGIQDENFSKKKKKDTTPNFLHRGPIKGVESEYDIYFGQILANKIRTHFLC